MKEAFILDLSVLAEQNLSITEFITLLKLNYSEIEYEIEDSVINSLVEKQFIKVIEENQEKDIIIRGKTKLLIEFLLIEGVNSVETKKVTKRSSRSIRNDIDEFIGDFRNLWKGLKPGSMGSIGGCREKMSRWMRDNPSYTKEDIMRAAEIYIKSLSNYSYLQQADYFIYKKDAFGESSRLSAFIDEIDVKDEGWSSSLN